MIAATKASAREAASMLEQAFPLASRDVLRSLAAARVPADNGLVLL